MSRSEQAARLCFAFQSSLSNTSTDKHRQARMNQEVSLENLMQEEIECGVCRDDKTPHCLIPCQHKLFHQCIGMYTKPQTKIDP